eukprot:2218961-Prymnesium_polylepis.1
MQLAATEGLTEHRKAAPDVAGAAHAEGLSSAPTRTELDAATEAVVAAAAQATTATATAQAAQAAQAEAAAVEAEQRAAA